VNLDLTTLPVDVSALHALVRDLAALMTGERAELARTKAEIDKLRLIIARLQRTQFGRRSEQIDNDQLALGLEDLDADIASIQARHPAASNEPASAVVFSRHGLPDHLPREDIELGVDTEHAFNKTTVYKRKSRNHLGDQIESFRIGDKDNQREDDLLDTFCYGIALALGDGSGF